MNIPGKVGPTAKERSEQEKASKNKKINWTVADFQGKYHTHCIHNDQPVPGTAIEHERRRLVQEQARRDEQSAAIDAIEADFREKVKVHAPHRPALSTTIV